jgi:hypothetical protein
MADPADQNQQAPGAAATNFAATYGLDYTPIEYETTKGESKHKILLKPFMDGFDEQAVREVMFAGVNIKVPMKQATKPQDRLPKGGPVTPTEEDVAEQMDDVEVPMVNSLKAQQKTMEIMVLSVDGCAPDEALKRLMRLSDAERKEVKARVEKITNPLGETKDPKGSAR